MRTIAFTDRALVVLATALLWSGCLIGRSAVAQEFRIETDVFLDDQKVRSWKRSPSSPTGWCTIFC